MSKITGKIKFTKFYKPENGYLIALFKVDKTPEKESYLINIIGTMPVILDNLTLTLEGEFGFNEKYNSEEFKFTSYKEILPTEDEKLISFLTSDLIKGCGLKTAEKLVKKYKSKTIEKIKDIENILKVEGITEKNAKKINDSILNFTESSDIIIELQNMNFTIEEASKIYNAYKSESLDVIKNNFYELKDIIYFKKLDSIYLSSHEYDDKLRLVACILETMKILSDNDGHTFYTIDLIKASLKQWFNLYLSLEDENEIISLLTLKKQIVVCNEKIYLTEYYEAEELISSKLKKLLEGNQTKILNFDEKLKELEKISSIEYDDKQKGAIKSSLINNVTIISGGPGTGKTTILNSIVKMYIKEKKLGSAEIPGKIALLAPTGRASKKMSMATGYGAYTIHRFLKWNKDNDTFEHNEDNKVSQEFIIIDECSMIDIKLFSALLKSLKDKVKLVLVGDVFQLPPVGAGLVFSNIIDSDIFNFTSLTRIYRQSENSFIPDLAYAIKTNELSETILEKKDDYNFFVCESESIKNLINQAIFAAKQKGIDETEMQILAPVYKGANGIDSLNDSIRSIYNPSSYDKAETIYNNIIYRENDKILQLVNDVEKNIFNGDIGYIIKIEEKNKKTTLTLKFEDTYVTVNKSFLKNITHAYAISIHKSQGSEFPHVIMPIAKEYFNMMYNKLLYTGVSRAKNSLILVGSPQIFCSGVNNNYTNNRNSNLKDKLTSIINEKTPII